jgi:hypothetical protein
VLEMDDEATEVPVEEASAPGKHELRRHACMMPRSVRGAGAVYGLVSGRPWPVSRRNPNVCSAHFHVSEPATLGGDVVVPLRESEFSQPSEWLRARRTVRSGRIDAQGAVLPSGYSASDGSVASDWPDTITMYVGMDHNRP